MVEVLKTKRAPGAIFFWNLDDFQGSVECGIWYTNRDSRCSKIIKNKSKILKIHVNFVKSLKIELNKFDL